MSAALEIAYLPLDEVREATANPKRHHADLGASIVRFGFADAPILDGRTGRLVAGHGRLTQLRAMAERGETPPAGVDLDDRGRWLVPVQCGWSSRSDDEAAAFLVAHNRIGEAGGWDDEELAQLLSDLDPGDLSGIGLEPGELSELLASLDPMDEAEDPGAGEPPEEPTSERGEVYALGPHRLMCGDSTSADDVAELVGEDQVALVCTDPPYAIYGSSTGVASDIADDGMVIPFFAQILAECARRLPLYGHAYVFCDWRSWAAWWQAARRAGMTPKNCVIWDKGGGGLGSNYANTHEFIGFYAREPSHGTMGKKVTGCVPVHKPNIIRENRTGGSDRWGHNASKPVGILTQLVENSSKPGGVVLDLFGGSGSTLIACAKTRRVSFNMEREEKWCDVIRRRWGEYARGAGVDPGPDAL